MSVRTNLVEHLAVLDAGGVERGHDAARRANHIRPDGGAREQHGALEVELGVVARVDFAATAEDVVEGDVQGHAVELELVGRLDHRLLLPREPALVCQQHRGTQRT